MRETFKDNTFRTINQIQSPGKTAEVYKVRALKKSGKTRKGDIVALKEYKKGIFTSENQVENVFKELDTGQMIKSERIVKTLGHFYEEEHDYLIMEWLDGETLEGYLEKNKTPEFEVIIEYCTQILEGLADLHNNKPKIIHCDIKPSNIKIVPERGIVILDLGIIRKIKDIEQVLSDEKFNGTIGYGAPEFLFGDPLNELADIFSIGVILYEMIFGIYYNIRDKTFPTRCVDRKNLKIYFRYFNKEIWERLGFKQSIFLAIALQKMLCHLHVRFSSKKLYNAFKNRIWEKSFYTSDDLESYESLSQVPPKYKYIVELMELIEKIFDTQELLFLATKLYENVMCENLSEDSPNLYDIFYKLHFTKLPYHRKNDRDIADRFYNFTIFGLEFLLKHYNSEDTSLINLSIDNLSSKMDNIEIKLYTPIKIEKELAAKEEFERLEKLAKDNYLEDYSWFDIVDSLPDSEKEKYEKIKDLLGENTN